MKRLTLFLFLLLALFSCQSEHKRQTEMLDGLLTECTQYETIPSLSDARSVLYYMERHGSPTELQQAWYMMAKVYHRHGSLFYEGFAYEMALDCVDSTSNAYNPIITAEILYESSINQYYNQDDIFAHIQARRAMELALRAGDTLSYYRYQGQDAYISLMKHHSKQFLPTAKEAFDELWQRGRKDWAVDAFFPYLVYMNNGTMNDSVAQWMKRYEQYTTQDLQHSESLAAVDYWKLRGDYFCHVGSFDSAHYYYDKLLQNPTSYAQCMANHGLLSLYDTFEEYDPDHSLRSHYGKELDRQFDSMKRERILEGKDEYCQRLSLTEHELLLLQHRTWLFCGLLLLVTICVFIIYRYRLLKRQHREILQQNHEYAELIKNSKTYDHSSLLNTDIAHRFHDLSAKDKHPSTDDWQILRNEIDRHHPLLFSTLQQQYVEHQPDQTLTEQECHVISLIVIKCSPLQMSVLLVCTKSNVSNLRRRLFNKLTGKDGSGTDLDHYVTNLCE
ncbi:MAG: hypothetical protein IJ635_04945 [Bacteroidaceae bacterium]|nr:hypothetical protein [Bacteroidaceae bacterium]